jgi:DNA methyltransferase 1-associated protein 1
MTRKKYVASLESRTTEQIAEEEALYIEIKRLEQNERRFKRERDELLRTLLGVDSGLPEIIGMVDDEGPMGGSTENGGKRRRRGTLDTPMTPLNAIPLGPPVPRRAQSAKSAAFGKLGFLCHRIVVTNRFRRRPPLHNPH